MTASRPNRVQGACAALLLSAGALAFQAAGAAPEADAAWQARHEQALRLYAEHDHAGAETAARAALQLAREARGQTQPYVASSLNTLALIRQAQARPDEAVTLLREALDLSEAALGAHPSTASLAFNLAGALEELQRPQDALRLYGRSLAIANAAPDGAQAADLRQKALAALGRLHTALGQSAQAEAYTRRLLDSEAAMPPLMRADALTRQAQALEARGEAGPARAALEQALALRETALGPQHIAVAHSLAALAGWHDRQGRHGAAEPLHRRALAIRETLDPQDPGIAGHLNELALWHLDRKEYGPAQALFGRALALVEQQHGARSLEAARLVASQALLHGDQKDDAQAQALHRRALAIYETLGDGTEALLGQAHAMNHLAGFVYRKRQFRQAEPMFQQALALMERALGTEDPRLLPVLDNLQALYRSQHRPDRALPYARRAETLREKTGAP